MAPGAKARLSEALVRVVALYDARGNFTAIRECACNGA
jgi:hypothetical protein